MKSLLTLVGLFFLLIMCGVGFWLVMAEPGDVDQMDDPFAHNKKVAPVKGKANSSGISNGNKAVQHTKRRVNSKSSAINITDKPSKFAGNIDQSLGDGTAEAEGIKRSKAEKKKVAQLNLQLFDALSRESLKNINVTLQYKFYGKDEVKDAVIADETGLANFSIASAGSVKLYVVTNDYSVYTKQVNIRQGDNHQKFYLYKGGSLEIRAFDKNKKVIEDLTVKTKSRRRSRWRRTSNLNPYVAVFNEKKGVHVIKNIPIGSGELSFASPGYESSAYFKVVVEKDAVVSLNVLLLDKRVISFRLLNNQEKIEMIGVASPNDGKTGLNGLGGIRSRIRGGRFRGLLGNKTKVDYGKPTEVFINEKGLFEYEMNSKNTSQLEVFVEGYKPSRVKILKDNAVYDLSLVKGLEGIVKVVSHENRAVSNVRVSFNVNKFGATKYTDVSGFVTISGLSKTAKLSINLSHANHLKKQVTWEFDEQNKTTTIQLEEGKSISGSVKFGETAIADAQIHLYRVGRRYPTKMITSNHDGSFSFGALDSSTYTIKAFHVDYGVALSKPIEFEKEKVVVDLHLVEENSLQLKFVTGENAVLPDFEVTLTSTVDPSQIISCKSNAEGLCDVKNLVHGRYAIESADPLKTVQTWSVMIPTDKVKTLKVVDKELKKLLITEPSGQIYNGPLKVSMEIRRSSWPIDVITNDKNEHFITLKNHRYMRNFSLVFETEGFALTRLGPYRKYSKIPKTIKVLLQEGLNYEITVLNAKNKMPVAFTIVELWQGRIKLQSLPTDEDGVVRFVHLEDKFTLKVYADGFAEYSQNVNGNEKKDFVVKLMKGGTLKGVYPFDDELSKATGYLRPGNKRVEIDSEGNFEVTALKPGEYDLTISRYLKSGKMESEKIPVKIVIVNEEIFILDLNNFRKNQTTLDIRVLKDGSLVTERGFLRINDRSGKMVIGVNVSNGKHLVEHIYPGEYVLSYYYKGKELKRKITLSLDDENAVTIKVPQASLEISVNDENGKVIPKALVTIYPGELYKIRETYMGHGRVTRGGKTTFSLMPGAPYYIIVEEDFRSNYLPQYYGPYTLGSNEVKMISVTLPGARALSKIKIVDENDKALKNVAFFYLDANNNVFQRRDWRNADLFPYSDKNGFLPKNSWPKSTFQLFVSKEGYESKSVQILDSVGKDDLVKIKLLKAASIKINIIDKFQLPISVGLLGNDGKLLDLPTPLSLRKSKKLSNYIQNVSTGSFKFNNLGSGTYYIGYYWNGSTNLISKQGPITVNAAENVLADSNFVAPQ